MSLLLSGRLPTWAATLPLLVLLIGVTSGCALGTRVRSPAPTVTTGDAAAGPPAQVTFEGTRFTNQAGFRLAAAHERPVRESQVILNGRLAEAEAGSHYVVVGVTVLNRSKQREAPYLVGEPAQVPRVWLGVPREQAGGLGVSCPDVSGLDRIFTRADWCAVPLRLKCGPVGSSALALPALPPWALVTDYLYSRTPLPDPALTDSKMSKWRFALQSGPGSFVELRGPA